MSPRRRRGFVAVIGLILAVGAGCAPAAGSVPAETASVRLTLDRPRVELAVPTRVAIGGPEAVMLVVTRIDNPAGRAFLLVAELRSPGRPPVRLGAVSPFPPDRTGRYGLSWKAAARAAGPDARLSLTLQPLRPEEVGDIAVELSATWDRPAG